MMFAAASFATPANTDILPNLPQDLHLNSDPQTVRSMPVVVLNPNPQAVQLGFYEPPIETGTVTYNGETFETIRMDGEGSTLEAGVPDVPRVTRMVMISNHGKVDLKLLKNSFRVESMKDAVAPVQLLDTKFPDGYASPNKEIYGKDEWYPAKIAEVSEPATLRDVRFVVVTIYPVQINPVTKQRRVYDEIEVEVANAGGIGPNEITVTPRSISPDFKKLYRNFENFEGSSLDALPEKPGKYIAICDTMSQIITQVQKLVDWKRRKGIDASIARMRVEISGANATNIQSYIANQYNASNGELEYVVLIGDATTSSASAWAIPTDASNYDNGYGCMSGDNPDPVPDIAVGRLSCRNLNQLANIVNKTIKYESSPNTDDLGWFKRGWALTNTSHAASNTATKKYTQEIMLQRGLSPVYFNSYPGQTNIDTLNNHLSEGLSVLNHRMSWISGEMDETDLNTCPVTNRNPFVMAITCGTGSYLDATTLSEKWLRPDDNPDANTFKGAIGAVGLHGSSTHTRFDNIIDAGVMYGLYTLDIEPQGIALIAGKLQLYRNYNVSFPSNVYDFSRWANLMGDPAVPIYRERPWGASVTAQETINVGTNNVSVLVKNSGSNNPIEGALVCLLKDSESFGQGYTDASGWINIPCTPETPGNLLLTVTHMTLVPYMDTITVVSSPAWLTVDTFTVDDNSSGGTSGDNNGFISPGETVDLSIELKNVGTSTSAANISGTLLCSAPGIQIAKPTSTYPAIVAGGTASPDTNFRFTVSAVFDKEPVTFLLRVTSSAGTETLRVDLTPRAPDVTYKRFTFQGPGGNIDPGENGDFTVTFRNNGQKDLVGAQGILRCRDPWVQVTDSIGDFGVVAAGALDSNNTDRFHIEINSGAYNGHRAVMELVITDANGFRDSTLFDSTYFFATDTTWFTHDTTNFYVTIGPRSTTSPTGPDGYGYYAYDNTETQPAGTAATYEWIELRGAGGTSLNFSDGGGNEDENSVLTLPFGFKFYGQVFTQITVCSNGWLAFGSYPLQTDFRNYRMGTPLGPPYQVAPYWDDLRTTHADTNVFYKYDATNHWYIVEWRARTLWTNLTQFFEVILYDTTYYPTRTGDGKIKFQYQIVNPSPNQDPSPYDDNPYASVGIQNGNHATGLDYCYWNYYSPGSATLTNGRAIMITTDATGGLVPDIDLSQPNGGEGWYVGQPYHILWSSSVVEGNVNIAINRTYPSGAWETLFSNTTNDGSQTWTVTSPASAGNARIRVTSVNSPTIGDTSDANISLVMPTATVISPNGGDVLIQGIPCYISWSSVGLGPVRVELNRNYPSATWEVLHASAGSGFNWIASGTPTANARIRIVGISVPTVGDTSDTDFIIGRAPIVTHEPHADQAEGTALFTCNVDDDGTFTTKLYYRTVGGANYDSVTFAATVNPNEYSATTTSLTTGQYEYFLISSDPQGFATYIPDSGTVHRFDVGALSAVWTSYDDGTAENYNWVDGPDFQWAVKFEPSAYPFLLYGGRFAICPTKPSTVHQPILFRVMLADGENGLPGTIVFSDTSACAGNVIGGLPSGAAWAEVITQSGGQPLSLSQPFYLSVQNPEVREHPVAFAHDTLGTRNHRSYIYDDCLGQWMNEDAVAENARPGNRMIRANGFCLAPVTIVVYKADSAGTSSAALRWTSNGAPYYRIYSSTNPSGPFNTLEGSIAGPAAGTIVTFKDLNAINEGIKRFYQVRASDTQ